MSLIKKPTELSVTYLVKALIYGQPGIGKTTLALSAPHSLLLDFDNGVNRVDARYQKDTVQVQSWEDVQNLLQENLSDYRTIVIDTVGKLLDYMTAYLIRTQPKMGKRDGNLTQNGYGARKVMFKNFVNQISMMGKHLVFVAHDKEISSEDERVVRPEIGGSSGNDLIRDSMFCSIATDKCMIPIFGSH